MIPPSSGILLIAEPFLKDPNFSRSVVMLCKHDDAEGSFGFVLNSILPKKLDQLVPELDGFDIPVYAGGPVQINTLHFIHQYPDFFSDCIKVTDEVYWGGDFDVLKRLLQEGSIDREKIRFYLGYSGWEAGQLVGEMKENTWITLHAAREIIFETPIDEIWKACLKQLGGKYGMMIHYPTDPQLN
jgi:putative transcriptional regulator